MQNMKAIVALSLPETEARSCQIMANGVCQNHDKQISAKDYFGLLPKTPLHAFFTALQKSTQEKLRLFYDDIRDRVFEHYKDEQNANVEIWEKEGLTGVSDFMQPVDPPSLVANVEIYDGVTFGKYLHSVFFYSGNATLTTSASFYPVFEYRQLSAGSDCLRTTTQTFLR